MSRTMLLKRILPICLALILLAGALFILFSGKTGNNGEKNVQTGTISTNPSQFSDQVTDSKPDAEIKSDGQQYPVNTIIAKPIATELPAEDLLPVVGDHETLLKLLLERGVLYDGSVQNNYYNFPRGALVVNEAEGFDVAAPMPSAVPSLNTPAASDAQALEASADAGITGSGVVYSQTNEQVVGVSEGDIVKTDGQYIYAMSPYGGTLRIIRADGSDMEIVSTITYNEIWNTEFYLIGANRLAIVGQEYHPMTSLPVPYDGADRAVPEVEPYYYDWYSRDFTILLIYDISDRAEPTELRRVSMDGWTVSTRVIGDIVYLVTNKSMWSIPYDQADSPAILPYCRDTAAGDDFEPVAYDRIYYIPDTDDCSYMLIGAIDVYSDDPFEPAAYLGAGSNLYMSQNAMYVTKWRSMEIQSGPNSGGDVWFSWREMTDILRFAVDGTNVAYTGMGTVDGSPINQYSMDENNGYFRIATTDWNAGTYVTILDSSDMQTVGRTVPLAPGEQMRSMRFMGDIGYVVTFQNVDPLFTIDLSDPYYPRVLGELKIPGFSQYLHPIGDGLMLGIGRDTRELYTRESNGVETVVGFRDVGMKASLFDVSNPADPKEIDVLTLGEGWAEVCDNPRALMVDRTRNLYGFIAETWNGRQSNNALVLSVENGRLSIAASLSALEYTNMYSSRLCFIKDTLYYARENGITAYNYNDFTKLGSITY